MECLAAWITWEEKEREEKGKNNKVVVEVMEDLLAALEVQELVFYNFCIIIKF